MRTLGLAVLLTGCNGATPTTEDLDPPASFAACAVPAGGFTPTSLYYTGVTASLTGPVLTAGVGDPPDGCFDDGGYVSEPEVDRARAAWFTAVDAAGVVWTAGMVLPDGALSLAAGDAVSAALVYQPGAFGPTIGSLAVSDGGGALLGWVGVGGDVPDLTPPAGLTLARGATVGSDRDDCGQWDYFALDAQRDGAHAEIPYGGQARLGDLTVWHGGYEESSGATGCPDWFVAHVAAAAAP